MALARNSDFTLLDYSEEINLIPKVWSLVSGLGLFEEKPIKTTVAQVEFVQEVLSDITSQTRASGTRNQAGQETAVVKNLNVPFFPLDRNITAADIQNFRAYGTGATEKTLVEEIARIMTRVRGSHAQLREKAMALAIQGVGFEGAGVGADYDYYTECGRTQEAITIDFTTIADPTVAVEEARRTIIRNAQDNTGSNASYDLIAICGEDFFSVLIAHSAVEDAYRYFESQQEPLRKRLGMGSEDSSVRVFRHKGVTYIEDLSGNFDAGEMFMFPRNVPDMFRMYISPANTPDYANTLGLPVYLWYKEDTFNRLYKVESESSFLCVNTRPELVVKATGTFA